MHVDMIDTPRQTRWKTVEKDSGATPRRPTERVTVVTYLYQGLVLTQTEISGYEKVLYAFRKTEVVFVSQKFTRTLNGLGTEAGPGMLWKLNAATQRVRRVRPFGCVVTSCKSLATTSPTLQREVHNL